MNQKIFNNLILLIIIFFIIKMVSPEKDSVLFILKKYVNYFSFQFKKILGLVNYNEQFKNITFNAIPPGTELAPKFKSPTQINFVNDHKIKNPQLDENDINNLYDFIQTFVMVDVYNVYMNPSNPTPYKFTNLELNKIRDLLLKKLNYSNTNFHFNNFVFENEPKYYLNIYGREIDPFTIQLDSNMGKLRIYIDMDIRDDIQLNKQIIIINEIKPLRDNQVINSYKNNSVLPMVSNQNSLQSSESQQAYNINYSVDDSIVY